MGNLDGSGRLLHPIPHGTAPPAGYALMMIAYTVNSINNGSVPALVQFTDYGEEVLQQIALARVSVLF